MLHPQILVSILVLHYFADTSSASLPSPDHSKATKNSVHHNSIRLSLVKKSFRQKFRLLGKRADQNIENYNTPTSPKSNSDLLDYSATGNTKLHNKVKSAHQREVSSAIESARLFFLKRSPAGSDGNIGLDPSFLMDRLGKRDQKMVDSKLKSRSVRVLSEKRDQEFKKSFNSNPYLTDRFGSLSETTEKQFIPHSLLMEHLDKRHQNSATKKLASATDYPLENVGKRSSISNNFLPPLFTYKQRKQHPIPSGSNPALSEDRMGKQNYDINTNAPRLSDLEHRSKRQEYEYNQLPPSFLIDRLGKRTNWTPPSSIVDLMRKKGGNYANENYDLNAKNHLWSNFVAERMGKKSTPKNTNVAPSFVLDRIGKKRGDEANSLSPAFLMDRIGKRGDEFSISIPPSFIADRVGKKSYSSATIGLIMNRLGKKRQQSDNSLSPSFLMERLGKSGGVDLDEANSHLRPTNSAETGKSSDYVLNNPHTNSALHRLGKPIGIETAPSSAQSEASQQTEPHSIGDRRFLPQDRKRQRFKQQFRGFGK